MYLAGIHYDHSGCPIEAFGHDRKGNVFWNNVNAICIMLSLVSFLFFHFYKKKEEGGNYQHGK